MGGLNKKTLTLLAASVLAASISPALAATDNGGATARVITPICIHEEHPIYFGKFYVGPVGGTVDAWHTNITGDILPEEEGETALWHVEGEPNYTFYITMDSSVTLTGPGLPMVASLTAPASAVLDGTGDHEFVADGVLNVNGNQEPGFYEGTYNIHVNY